MSTITGQATTLLRHDGDGFVVDTSAFDDILRQTDLLDRKLIVLSIVGEYRRGKSFFINFVMRYLLNQNNPYWMSEDASKLKGFSWRRGMKRETDGIVMWSRAFPLGDEYAVVLLDTEGTYDEQSTNKTMSHVFACSALISSLQIFNVHEKINKHTMHEIQAFSEFGRLASCSETITAFQKLMFLVRDWNFENNVSFGLKGGQEHLEHWLMCDKDGVKDTLTTCFSDVSCYLMPYPGDKVKNDQNFAGNVDDMHPNFRTHVNNVIEVIFSPKFLECKNIGGEELKLKDFMTYFSMFAKTLNESGIEPNTLFKTQVESCSIKAKAIATEFYKNTMDELTQGDEPIDDLEGIHEAILTQALNEFDSYPKVGGNENATTYRNLLCNDVSLLFAKYQNSDFYKNILQRKIGEKEEKLLEAELRREKAEIEHKHAMDTELLKQQTMKRNWAREEQCQAEDMKLQIHRFEQEAATERMKMKLRFQDEIEELKQSSEDFNQELEDLKERHERELNKAKANTERSANQMRASQGEACRIM